MSVHFHLFLPTLVIYLFFCLFAFSFPPSRFMCFFSSYLVTLVEVDDPPSYFRLLYDAYVIEKDSSRRIALTSAMAGVATAALRSNSIACMEYFGDFQLFVYFLHVLEHPEALCSEEILNIFRMFRSLFLIRSNMKVALESIPFRLSALFNSLFLFSCTGFFKRNIYFCFVLFLCMLRCDGNANQRILLELLAPFVAWFAF